MPPCQAFECLAVEETPDSEQQHLKREPQFGIRAIALIKSAKKSSRTTPANIRPNRPAPVPLKIP